MKRRFMALVLTTAMAATMFTGCGESKTDSTTAATTAQNSEKADSTTAATEKTDAGSTDATTAATDGAPASTYPEAVQNLISATSGTVDLTLWCSETEAYQTVMAKLVDDFKATYPDVDFNITIGAVSEADAKDEVLNDVEAAADVFVFADDQLTELVNAGALQEIAATFTYDPATTNAASTVEAAKLDGKLYAYPLTASNGYFLYYDSSVFSESDVASWEALEAKAVESGVNVGMELSNGWYNYGFFAGAGLQMYLNDDGATNTCNWNATDTTPTGAQVAEAVSNIAKNSSFVSMGNADATAAAANGTLKAFVDGTWDSGAFKDAYGDGYAAAKLPTFNVNGTDYQMSSFAGYKFVGVNAYSKNTGWAMLLGEFLTNESSQTQIGVATGEGPANTVAASSEEIASSPALAALAAQAAFANLQRVGGNYWTPAATLGQQLLEGVDDYQAVLDEAVLGITQ